MELRGGLHGGPWRSVEASREIHGGSVEASMEAPWRSIETSTELHGDLHGSSRELHGDFHGVPDNVAPPPIACYPK